MSPRASSVTGDIPGPWAPSLSLGSELVLRAPGSVAEGWGVGKGLHLHTGVSSSCSESCTIIAGIVPPVPVHIAELVLCFCSHEFGLDFVIVRAV